MAECPHCGATVPTDNPAVNCPGCLEPLQIVDVPDMPCRACGVSMALPKRGSYAHCPKCGVPNSVDPLVFRTRCARCRRLVEVSEDAVEAECPHCNAALRLRHTL